MSSAAETRHIQRVKEMACSVCDQPGPSDFHHILEGRTPGRKSPAFCGIPLCKSCHQDPRNGVHGMASMWKIFKKSELQCLADTIETLYG